MSLQNQKGIDALKNLKWIDNGAMNGTQICWC